ncbi:hypothetical protein ScPMuIL_007541, partial [Solemya velum]
MSAGESSTSQLLKCSDHDFDSAIQEMDLKNLLSNISNLQGMMSHEQENFNSLKSDLSTLKKNSRQYKKLAAEMSESQNKLTHLMNRSMKCFAQVVLQKSQSVDDLSSTSYKSERPPDRTSSSTDATDRTNVDHDMSENQNPTENEEPKVVQSYSNQLRDNISTDRITRRAALLERNDSRSRRSTNIRRHISDLPVGDQEPDNIKTSLKTSEDDVSKVKSDDSVISNKTEDLLQVKPDDEMKDFKLDEKPKKKTPPKTLSKPKTLKLDKVYWFDVNKQPRDDKSKSPSPKSPSPKSSSPKSPEKKGPFNKMSSSMSYGSLDRPQKFKKMPKSQSSDSNLNTNQVDFDNKSAEDQRFTSIKENPFIRNDKTKVELKSRNFSLPNVWQKYSGKNIELSLASDANKHEDINNDNPFAQMLKDGGTPVDDTGKSKTVSPVKVKKDEKNNERGTSPEKAPRNKSKAFSRKGSFGKKHKKRQVSQVQKQTWNHEEKKFVPESERTSVSDADSTIEDISHKFVAMEGLMEKLPMNKKKATLLKTWKRRYFRATDGWLHYYESSNRDRANESIQLMGGRIDELGNRILGIDDGRGRCLMVRVPTEKEYGQWKLALESQTADNVKATYIRPVLKSKPHRSKRVVIIDIGSSAIRAGVLGDQATLPQLFFPSVTAINKASKQLVLGSDCYKPEIRQNFTLSYPVRPTNKVDKFNIEVNVMPIVFQKIFADLKVKPEEYLVMLSTPQNLSDKLREGLMKILVDKYHVMGVCMVQQSLLALYSYNATSGIIVDIGERMEILPIYDGMLIEGGVSRQAYGGQKVLDSLNISLMENKYKFSSPVEKLIVRYIMEKSCYVAENYKDALTKVEKNQKSEEMTVQLDKYNLPEKSYS